MNNPPEKYWQLLELALADFDEIRKDPNYVINMMVYHAGRLCSKCQVCLAGSVIARTLHGDPTKLYSTDHFPEWHKALRDISSMALGSHPEFLSYENKKELYKFQDPIQHKPYHVDPAHWRAHMGHLVQWLKERDL